MIVVPSRLIEVGSRRSQKVWSFAVPSAALRCNLFGSIERRASRHLLDADHEVGTAGLAVLGSSASITGELLLKAPAILVAARNSHCGATIVGSAVPPEIVAEAQEDADGGVGPLGCNKLLVERG